MLKTVLVTGATGFVGAAMLQRLAAVGQPARAAYRHIMTPLPTWGAGVAVGDLGARQDWRTALDGVATVVHTAARVHLIQDAATDPMAEYRRVNVEGTINLARQAAASGVRRFVFLSSIKVNGEFTEAGQPFTADDEPTPENSYGVSKYEAEQLLRQIAAETGMEVVIIRPPLVYGPGVKANFESMMRWLVRGVPLPLAAVTQNRRSLVALDNLVDLIVTCLNHPAAANQTFLASDGEDLSTAELLKRMGAAMGKPARLFYVTPALLKLGATLLNKPGIYQRLCGSLQLDIAKTRQLLEWTPPMSVDEGLRRAAEGFRS
ncbi:SDR family oxidoreductase [Laribacter hongkongensis]|uniref:UDP-glucose 4-epimerase family protein n=1 Tax=Laribacter hongkongensis TaxID=168471 RepID=UPI0027E48346|nr:SDR family oxidoreductase [Laribacter hongkongensis]MCG9022841.1 SDR family oxidoreductase [Laribacter hongkongensis]